MSEEKTIFKRIIDKEIPADIVHEDEFCIAFRDVSPQAPIHVLVIPKEEISSLKEVEAQHQSLMGHLMLVSSQLAEKLSLDEGYRVVINCGDDGGQSIDHLHLHVMGGRKMSWPPG